MIFEVVEDDVIPELMRIAYEDGKEFQVMTSIGWITIDDQTDIQFRNGVTYRVKP